MSQEEKNIPVEQQRLEKEQIEDMGQRLPHPGSSRHPLPDGHRPGEGHVKRPQGQKTHQV